MNNSSLNFFERPLTYCVPLFIKVRENFEMNLAAFQLLGFRSALLAYLSCVASYLDRSCPSCSVNIVFKHHLYPKWSQYLPDPRIPLCEINLK